MIGAGVFGAWTAHHLRAAGLQVTLVDAYGAGNPRSSSGDESRIVRCGYGPDEIYSRFAHRALDMWRALAARVAGPALWHQSGVLWLAGGDDPYTAATRDTLERAGYPVAALSGGELRTRYSQLETGDISMALLEPECGVVVAWRAVRALVSELVAGGMTLRRARVTVPALEAGPIGPALQALAFDDGSTLHADGFVFACGAWLPRLFPDLLTGRIRATRQSVIYFGTPPGDDRFSAGRMPAWIDFPAGIYGVPDIEDRGVKVGIDEHGPPIDPDTDDRVTDAANIARARAWLARRVPALADAPVVDARVCQYENTASGDFLIDRHPGYGNAWIVGGGSGHGFKHGPAVGEYAARLITDQASIEPRFALAGKDTQPRRAVY